jgi:proteasome lid subunit RPN8/RPN11
VTIADGVVAAIVAHARAEAPRECCGLLLGTSEHIAEAYPARNIDPAPIRRYLIDPRDHLAAVRRARARGVAVVGAYHSHPRSPAVPSATDAAEGFSDFVYLIIGEESDAPEITAWSWTAGNFAPLPLVRVG